MDCLVMWTITLPLLVFSQTTWAPPVSVISSAVFNVLVRLHICKSPSIRQVSVPPSLVSFAIDINNTAALLTNRYVSVPNYVNPTGNQSTEKSIPSIAAIPNLQTEHIQSIQTNSIPLPPIPPPISVSNNNS
ncbi:hypothetical protein MN116_004713 [Schistosoma mekongi]|uniref:Uncharacterized protein n=1 Tax=Schistosoma mekongi TaxID=38744 RepID=A0AAE1ZD39_SCHME|nr:hypothetical protein MN116_004713 [Schistosoma mekongi]